MAYNSDQAEIDAMPMESGMATMSTAPGPDTATAMLNENVSNLRSAINGLSTQIMSLTRSTYSIAKSAAQGATRDINIDSNAFGDRVGAAVGGPLGVIVHRAIANSGLTQTIGSSLRSGLSSLSSKIKSLGANKYDSQSGMFDVSSITRSTQLQTSILTNELRSGISQPLKIANSIHNEQLTQTKIGNDSIVHAVDSLSKANRVDSSLSHNRLEMINRSINSTMPGMTEELTNAINGLNNSFRDSSVSQGGGLIKGVFKGILDMTKVGTLFKGKYTNDIQKSVNPLETQVSALLQIYRWQRLYGELTKRQLNQLIKLSGGQEQDVIGKNGVLSEFLTKNPDILNKVFDKALGGGKLSGFAKFMSQMAIDSEAYDDRMRMAASADLSKLTKKKDVSGKDIFDTFVPFKSKTLSGPENYFDISYKNLQKGLDALSSRFDGFDKVIKVMEHSGYDFYHSKQTEDNLKKLKEDKKKVKEDSSLSAEDKNKKIEDLDKEIKKLKEKQKETSKYKAEPRIFKNTKRTSGVQKITPNPIYDSSIQGIVSGSVPVTIVGNTLRNEPLEDAKPVMFAKGGFVKKPVGIAGEAGPEAIVPVKKEKGNLTQKLADIITNSKTKLLEKILSKFETTNAILLESKKHQKDSSKTLESVAKYSKETANAETIENKIHLEEEKKKKKNSFWDNIGAKKKEKKPGGILGSLGSLLTNPYVLMLIAAFFLFPNQTKSLFKWMFSSTDRFLKGLTLPSKFKKAVTGGAKGIWQGIKSVSKGVGKGISNAVKSGKGVKSVVKAAAQGLKSGTKAIPIVKTVRTVGALMKQGKSLVSSVGAVIGKNISKTLAKGGLKAFAKRVPIVGSLLSVAFAINRFRKGEIRGGLLELLSGGLGLIDVVAPGLGSALSLATDFLNIWLDNKADKKKAEETKGVKGVGEKVEEVKKEEIPDKEKKDVSTNLEKAKEHAEKGNTVRAGYYGYQGIKDMKGAEDKKPKTPQPVAPYNPEYELYDGMLLYDENGNVVNPRKRELPVSSAAYSTVNAYDKETKTIHVGFHKAIPGLPLQSMSHQVQSEIEPEFSVDNKTGSVTIKFPEFNKEYVIDYPFPRDDVKLPKSPDQSGNVLLLGDENKSSFDMGPKAYKNGGFLNTKKYAEGGYYSTKPNYFIDTQNQLSVHGEAGPEAIIPLNNRPGNLLNNLGFELRNILYGYRPTGPISKDTSGSKSSVGANDSASLPMTRYLAMQIAKIIKPYKNGGFKYEDPFIMDASQYYKIHSDKTSSFVDKTKISDTNGNIKEFGYTLQNSYLEPVQGFWKNFANEISNRFVGKDIFKPQVKTSTIQKYYDSESISNNRWFNNKNKGLTPGVSSGKSYDFNIKPISEKAETARIPESTPTKPNYENYGSASKQYKDTNDKNQNKTLSYTVTTSVNGKKVSKTYTFSTAGKFYDPIVSVRYITVNGKGTQIAIRTHASGKTSRRSSITIYEGDDPDLWTSYDGKSTDKASNQPIIEKAKSAAPKEEKATAKERLSTAGSGALDIAKGLTGYEIAKGVVVGAGKGIKNTASNLVSAGGHFINAATSIPREVIIGTVKGAGHVIGGIGKGIGQVGWGALSGVGQAGWGALKGAGQVVGGAAKGIGQAGWGVLKGAGQAVGGIGKGIWNGAIKGVGGGLIDIIKGNGEEGLKSILKGIGTVGIETVKGLGKGIYSVGAGVIKGGWSLIKGTVKGIGSAAAGLVKGGWSLIKGTVKGIGSAAAGVVKGIYSIGKGLVKGAVGVITGIGKGVWSLTKAVASLPVQIAKGAVNGVVNTYKSVKSGIGKIWDSITGKKKDKSNVPTGVNNYNIRTLASTNKEDSKELKKDLIVYYNLICKNKEFMKEHSFHVRDIMGSDKSDREKFRELRQLYSKFKGRKLPEKSSTSGVTPQSVANYKVRVLAGENQPKATKDIVAEGGAKILAHAGVYDKAVKGTAKLAKRGLSYIAKTGSKLLNKTEFGRNLLSRASAIKNSITSKILKSKPVSMLRVYKNGVKNLGFKKATVAAGKGLLKSAKKATIAAATKGYTKLKSAASAYKSLVSSKGFKGANKELLKKASDKVSKLVSGAKSSKPIKTITSGASKAIGKIKNAYGATKGVFSLAKSAIKSKGFIGATKAGLSAIKNTPKVAKIIQGGKNVISAAKTGLTTIKNASKVANIVQGGKKAISAAKAGFGMAKGVITGGFKTLMSGGLKSGLKAGLKGAMKGGWKAAIKKIPILGGILSLFFAFQRFKKGEWGRGIIELLSGVASCIPGIGTGISIVLDVLNMFLDSKMNKAAQETESIKNPEIEKKEKKGPAWIARFMKYFNKAKDHWKKGNYLRAIGCGMAAMALGNPVTGGITNWFMKKLGVVNDDDTTSGKDNEGVDDKAEKERKRTEEEERKKKERISNLTRTRDELKKKLEETPDNIWHKLERSIYNRGLKNTITQLEELGVKQNGSTAPTSVDSAANQVTHAKDTTNETDGVQIIEKELGVTDQMKSDMKETEKLKATNKVYAHKKANEQLNKSINDNSSRTNNAIINSGKVINSSVSKVNNNIVNNNSTENPTNSSIYMPVGAINANSL